MSVREVTWPSAWRSLPLWSLFERVKDVGHPQEQMLSVYRDHGVVPKDGRDDNFNKTAENRNIYQLVYPGWLVVNRMKAWQGSVGISFHRGIVSGHYICFRPRHDEDPRFLNYLLRSSVYAAEFHQLSRGVRPSQMEIDNDWLRVLPVRVPSVGTQRTIADYLDAETARIDALIERKERMKALIAERWQAAMRAVAIRYLPWLPLRRTWTITDCKHRTPIYGDEAEGYPVVSPGDVEAGRINLQRCHRFVNRADYVDLTEAGRRPRRGDVIYSRNASIGIAAYVDTDEPFTMGQDVCLIRSDSANQLWLSYMLNSVGLDQLNEMKVGSTFDRVNIRQLLDLRIPAPPAHVQRHEAEKLDAEGERIQTLLSRLTLQCSRLAEHRRALISAAVTGELNVPGIAA